MHGRLSALFHRQSKKLLGTFDVPEEYRTLPLGWKEVVSKSYPRLPRISLPHTPSPSLPLGEALVRRTSYRDYQHAKPPTLTELATILKYSAGAKDRNITNWYRRFYPSGGGLYPLEIYIATEGGGDLNEGLYHYHVGSHSLEVLGGAETLQEIRESLTYAFSKTAPTLLLITCVWGKNFNKYRDFGYPAVLLEAGHLAQNLILTATSAGVRTCPSAGFLIDETSAALDINPLTEGPVHLLLMGKEA